MPTSKLPLPSHGYSTMNVHNSVQVVFQRKMKISSQNFACMECREREGERAGLTQQLFARLESLAKESKRTRSIASSTRMFIELEIRSSVEVEVMRNTQILRDLEAIKCCKIMSLELNCLTSCQLAAPTPHGLGQPPAWTPPHPMGRVCCQQEGRTPTVGRASI